MFDSHDQFQAEYLLMSGKKRIADHFHVVRKADEVREMLGAGVARPGISAFAMEGYFVWEPAPTKALPFNQIMKREQFETWIYGHFIKTCLPCPRPLYSDRPVYSPLNVTIIFRLLEHLIKVGYPTHWMSDIVASICDGRITTRARPSRTIVMRLSELAEKHPKTEMSVAAWQAEFTSLFPIWRRILPFGVIVPQGAVPSLQSIREHAVTFPMFKAERMLIPHFILVFWDTQNAHGPEPPQNIWDMLLSDHVGIIEGIGNTTLKSGIHIVTTFRFTTRTRTASFWMRDDVVQNMKSGAWRVYIWRTDVWDRQTEGVNVADNLKDGQSWLES